jgi:hypothetical protein
MRPSEQNANFGAVRAFKITSVSVSHCTTASYVLSSLTLITSFLGLVDTVDY